MINTVKIGRHNYKLDTNWQEDRQLRKKHRLYPEFLSVIKEDNWIGWEDTDVDFYDWAMSYEIDSDLEGDVHETI